MPRAAHIRPNSGTMGNNFPHERLQQREPGMLVYIAIVILALAALVWSADRFVLAASRTARTMGLPPLLVGLTVVAMGTSAPELLVSATAAVQGRPGIAIGNALGSNIANIALILGLTALIAPVAVYSRLLRREFPALILTTGLAILLMANNQLTRLDGLILLAAFIILLTWLAWLARQGTRHDPLVSGHLPPRSPPRPLWPDLLWLIASLLVLLLSAQLLVGGAASLARELGVSETVIGLSMVAAGTSLPELATCVTATLRRQFDIAIGNILGSNLFNILAVLMLPALLAPGPLPDGILVRDLPVMAGLTVLLYLMCRGWPSPYTITRREGLVLLGIFALYQSWLFVLGNGG